MNEKGNSRTFLALSLYYWHFDVQHVGHTIKDKRAFLTSHRCISLSIAIHISQPRKITTFNRPNPQIYRFYCTNKQNKNLLKILWACIYLFLFAWFFVVIFSVFLFREENKTKSTYLHNSFRKNVFFSHILEMKKQTYLENIKKLWIKRQKKTTHNKYIDSYNNCISHRLESATSPISTSKSIHLK